MVTIWTALKYIKKGPLATGITTHQLVRVPLYYCRSVFFAFTTNEKVTKVEKSLNSMKKSFVSKRKISYA